MQFYIYTSMNAKICERILYKSKDLHYNNIYLNNWYYIIILCIYGHDYYEFSSINIFLCKINAVKF